MVQLSERSRADRRTIKAEELVRLANRDIDASREDTEQMASWRSEMLREYRGQPYGNEKAGRSKIVLTDIQDAIEWIMPSLMRIFAGSQSAVHITAVGDEDQDRAKKTQALVTYQLQKKNDYFQTFYVWFKNALRFKTSVIKRTWRYEYEAEEVEYHDLTEEEYGVLATDPFVDVVEAVRVEVTPAATPSAAGTGGIVPAWITPPPVYSRVRVRVKTVLHDGPVIENVRPETFYIDPTATGIRDAMYCGQILTMTASEMRERADAGAFDKKAVERAIEKGGGEDRDSWTNSVEAQERASANGLTAAPMNGDIDEKDPRERFTVYEHYSLTDVDGDGRLEKWVSWICNDELLDDRENVYGEFPFSAISPILEPHSFYGVSIAEMVRDVQRIKTSLTRLMLDNAAFQVNGRYGVIDGQATISDLVNKNVPGGYVRMRTPGAVFPLQQPSLPNWTFQLMEYVESVKENRTGVTRYNQGLDASSLNKTATGIQTITNASMQRIELIARIFAETGVTDLIRSMIAYNNRFLSREVQVRLYGEPMTVYPEDLRGEFDLDVAVGVGNMDLKQQAQSLMMGLQATVQMFGPAALKVAPAIMREWWKAEGFRNAEQFVPDEASLQGGMNGMGGAGVAGPGAGVASGGGVGNGSEVTNRVSADTSDINGLAGGLNLRLAQ